MPPSVKTDLIMLGLQCTVALAICGMATFAAVNDQIISGDALVGLYGAAVGYVFGHQSGSRKVSIEGPTVVEERRS